MNCLLRCRMVASTSLRRQGTSVVSSTSFLTRSISPRTTTTTTVGRALLSSSFSTSSMEETPEPPVRYAVVEHFEEYQNEMAGLHGQQLNLAYEEVTRNDGKYLPDNLLDEFGVTLDDLIESKFSGTSDNSSNQEEETEEEEGGELANEDEEDDDEEEFFSNDVLFPSRGISKSDQIAYKAGAASGGTFAIINLNGSQHKVALDDVVVVNKLKPVEKWKVGETITLDSQDVLLLGSTQRTFVGLPCVSQTSGASVKVHVEEITRDATTITFKKRRKKHSQRKRGSRREVTFLRIVEINLPTNYQDEVAATA